MRNSISVFTSLQKIKAVSELQKCNEITKQYGLSLSQEQIRNLIENRFFSLSETGRIEFSQGITKKIIERFCDSPYIHQENYEETICHLQELFYYMKNETKDQISDDLLILLMRQNFDDVCKGSIDYLQDVLISKWRGENG